MTSSRWILAYNDRCGACEQTAKGVVDVAKGKIEVRGLLDPEILEMRRATGHADDWQPILFRRGDRPRAYVGPALAGRMTVILGLRRALRAARMMSRMMTPVDAVSSSGRRRFLKNAAFLTASLAGLGAAGRLAFSTTSSSPTRRPGQMLSERLLREGDPTLVAALASAPVGSIIMTHGRAALGDTFVHATYEGISLEAVAFQLTPSSGPMRLVYAYFQSGDLSRFQVFQLEIVPDKSFTKDSPFTGTARALAADDSVIGVARYLDGQLVETASGTTQVGVQPYYEDWACASNCLNNTWPHLPWYVQAACLIACGACIGGVLPACGGCLGCLGGYGAACWAHCWR